MATFRAIDIKHVIQRREEANGCLTHRYFNAAILTAGSGIELLMEFLVKKLYDELNRKSRRRAGNLQRNVENEEQKNSAKIIYWGLNRWVDFYRRKKIFKQLHNEFNYSFQTLNNSNLKEVNKIWNKCKHDSYMASFEDANEIVYFLNEYFIETEINLEENYRQCLTVGDISKHWLGDWEKPLASWTVANLDAPQTEILLSLTPYLDLVIRLIDDKRIRFEHKTALMVAANYVFSSLDLFPEDTDKQDVHGLVDDGAVLALSLFWLLQQDQFDQAIISSNWTGGASIINEAKDLKQYIYDNQEILFPDSRNQFGYRLAWKVIKRISSEGPEALWQNYWQEQYNSQT